MGQSNQCNCHCGGNKRYTCYNGFCVEDALGEYDNPSCNGFCPTPTQYACISGYCIPTVGGPYNNPACNEFCPPMPTKRYSCSGGFCVQTRGGSYYEPTCGSNCPPRSIDYGCVGNFCIAQNGGPYKNDPFCDNNCGPVINFRYDCDENGQCVPTINGRYINDSTCGGNCPNPSGTRYKCQDGQCVQAIDGIYINDPTCGGNCSQFFISYLLVNCQNENETLIAKAPSGAYNPPFNGVWKINDECWRMVGTINENTDAFLPDTKTPGCDSCNNGICCFEVWPCSWQNGEVPTNGFNCNINTGKCEISPEGPLGPQCNDQCDTFFYKICVSGLDPSLCSSYVGKTIKITPCDQPFVLGDFGPPCTPAPGWMLGCECCFHIANSIPEDPEATHHNLIAIYQNCSLCNPCETKECSPGFIFDQNVCDCVCLDPPCGGDPPVTGACCDVSCDVITCIDGYTVSQCNSIGGTFFPGQNCANSPCVPQTCEENPGCCSAYECDGFGNCIPTQFGMTLEQCQQICFVIEE